MICDAGSGVGRPGLRLQSLIDSLSRSGRRVTGIAFCQSEFSFSIPEACEEVIFAGGGYVDGAFFHRTVRALQEAGDDGLLCGSRGRYLFFPDSGAVSRVPGVGAGEVAESFPFELIEQARAKGLTLSCAESCTGGAVAAWLTAVPGASAVFRGGVTAYDNSVKESLLRVSGTVLHDPGAVSEACVRQMAAGVRNLFCSDLAVSVSGIAGPDGGSAEKPPGTVYFGLASASALDSFSCRYSGGREDVREASVAFALNLLTKGVNNA